MARDVRQAVIMVGGKGTRLRPLTDNCPKPILPILDRPCMDYLIDSLVEAGIDDIILACGYKSEKMACTIGDGSSRKVSITYSYEDRPMGTAGAIKLLEDRLDDVFMAVNGDVFTHFTVEDEIKNHIDSKAAVTISLTTVSNPCEYGIVRIDGTGKITEFKEKPKSEEVFSNLINSGVYVVNKEVLKFVPEGEIFDFSKELVPLLVEKGYRIQGHPIDGTFRDVGRPKDLFDVNVEMAAKHCSGKDYGDGLRSSVVQNEFYAGENTVIDNSSLDRAIVHNNCKIEDTCLKNSLILSDCIINSATIIGSILGKGCVVEKGAKIVDSVLADGSVVERNQTIEKSRGI